MGAIDTFLQAHASSGLEPGETIQGMAHIRQPYRLHALLGTPEAQTEHLAVATDRRLIIFSTELGGLLTPVLQPRATPPVTEWRYHDLARVVNVTPTRPVVHSGGAVVEMTLVPHPFCGPFAGGADEVAAKRYDVYRAADGLDAQGAFFAQFPTWLKGAVEAGRFPLPAAKRAEIDAKRAAIAAQLATDAAERDRRMKAAGAAAKRLGPFVAVALATLALSLIGSMWTLSALDRTSGAADRADRATRDLMDIDDDLKWMRAGLPPPALCDPKERPGRVQYDHTTGSVGFDEYGCGCKKVRTTAAKPTPLAGWKVHLTSYAWHYECPPLATYEAARAKRVSFRDDAEDDRTSSRVESVVGAVLTLAILVGGVVASLVLRKRVAAS